MESKGNGKPGNLNENGGQGRCVWLGAGLSGYSTVLLVINVISFEMRTHTLVKIVRAVVLNLFDSKTPHCP